MKKIADTPIPGAIPLSAMEMNRYHLTDQRSPLPVAKKGHPDKRD